MCSIVYYEWGGKPFGRVGERGREYGGKGREEGEEGRKNWEGGEERKEKLYENRPKLMVINHSNLKFLRFAPQTLYQYF